MLAAPEDFATEGNKVVWLEFKDIYEIYHLDALNTDLIYKSNFKNFIYKSNCVYSIYRQVYTYIYKFKYVHVHIRVRQQFEYTLKSKKRNETL
jgi:hypothetical protein